jgi:ABC-2 type transport system ATP-binding protein
VGVMGEGKLLEVDTPTGLRHKAFGGDIVELRTNTRLDYQLQVQLRDLPYVVGPITRTGDNSARLIVKEARSAVPDLMDWTQQNNIEVETIEEHQPPFDDVFVKLVQRDRTHE